MSSGGEDGSSLASISYSYQGTLVGTAALTVQAEEEASFPYSGSASGLQERGALSLRSLALYGGIAAGALVLLILLVHGLRRKKKKRPLRMSPSLRGRSRRRR